MDLNEYLPQRLNSSHWLTWYTLERLRTLDAGAEIVLPICSLGTPCAELSELGDLVLPPLYHEALDPELQHKIVAQIQRCFPYYELTRQAAEEPLRLRIAELPRRKPPATARPKVLAFSVDTAVEEHGPHLPLATDTIQSYGVLRHVASEMKDVLLGPPVEYGQLTWGLPFGFSIDLTAPLLTEYVAGMVNALIEWMQPNALYVVDVHGSIVHLEAIVAGLETSHAETWSFRWLHELAGRDRPPVLAVEIADTYGPVAVFGVGNELLVHTYHALLGAKLIKRLLRFFRRRGWNTEKAIFHDGGFL